MNSWMIYGANGYTGELIAREAVVRGMKPILAGRNQTAIQQLATELKLPCRVFALEQSNAAVSGDGRTQHAAVIAALEDVSMVLHCAGPFSATAAAMMAACLSSGTHYLDITGEISVFEHGHNLDHDAIRAGIVICPGVGFDVVPTDCLAALLHRALPDANKLRLGFDSRSGFSPGTAKTSIEGLGQGGRVRRKGQIVCVPLAYKTREIDFGSGRKLAMTIPWGDVSSAFYTTSIGDIEVYIPASPRLVRRLKQLNWIRPILALKWLQNILKARIDKKVTGPNQQQRQSLSTRVWGEVSNAKGETRSVRIVTSNGYALTVNASLAIVVHLQQTAVAGGYYTPSQLVGADLLSTLPGTGEFDWAYHRGSGELDPDT